MNPTTHGTSPSNEDPDRTKFDQHPCPGCSHLNYATDKTCYDCGCSLVGAVITNDAKPPELPEAYRNRMALIFALVEMQGAAAEVQRAAADVMLFGPDDDGDGEPQTKQAALNRAYDRLTACATLVNDYLPDQRTIDEQDDAVEFHKEVLRMKYQTSSGRGLLRLPLYLARE